ncbi:hypothetical protein MTR67_023341 [Solanum verrucosum]|uniref:Malic enzyme NAD-binding domain-containing protein n=1 Tax=Solanum verrucosum TaxID=315347 RepID=A0AAF0QV09_SOLVR|nr:hypothetical protein MTR67_023341 [Solanum verrucosum]
MLRVQNVVNLNRGKPWSNGNGYTSREMALYTALGEVRPSAYEDFANHNAFELLAKYRTTHLVFNDDIQGIIVVVLAGLVASLMLLGGSLANHTFLFFGAGEAGTGKGELIALAISKKTNVPVEEARKNIWLVDSKESLQAHKKPWEHEREPVNNLLDTVKRPLWLSQTRLHNPNALLKKLTLGVSGSLFPSVEYNNKLHIPSQANNCYIFPRFGLGLVMIGTIRVHNDMLLAASKALASQVTEEHYVKGIIYPLFGNIRKITTHIAANVAAKAYELGEPISSFFIICLNWI